MELSRPYAGYLPMFSELFNTIFVHIPKTGGQSIEQVFLQMHGLTRRDRSALLLGKNRKSAQPKHLAHLYAVEYRECGYITSEVFSSCLKFTAVRNPLDRMLSEYRYRVQKRNLPFAEFAKRMMRSSADRHIVPQCNYVLDRSGNVMVDRIIRFESLVADFEQISRDIFGRPAELPHLNKSRAEVTPVALDAELRNFVYKRYECDFDLFRYPSGREYHHIHTDLPLAAERENHENAVLCELAKCRE
jgi:hypothetical protein